MSNDPINDDAAALARLHVKQAIGALVTVLRDPTARRMEKIAAAEALLARGYGKPKPSTIAVPQRKVLRKALQPLSDDELLSAVREELAGRGEYPPEKGTREGSHARGTPRSDSSQSPRSNKQSADQSEMSPSYARLLNGGIPDLRDLLPEEQAVLDGDEGEQLADAATTVQLAANDHFPFEINEGDVVEGEYTARHPGAPPEKGTQNGSPESGNPWD